jgi:Skp family chaperone for outer membrane proteins
MFQQVIQAKPEQKIGYLNVTEIIINHPLMALWDPDEQSFRDNRGLKVVSESKILLLENMKREFENLTREEENLIPLMNLLRKEWQLSHPAASDAEVIAAFTEFEKEYFRKRDTIQAKKGQIETNLSPIGFTTEDLLIKRENRFDEVLKNITSDITRVTSTLKNSRKLDLILDSSCLDEPSSSQKDDHDSLTGSNPLSDLTAINLVSDILDANTSISEKRTLEFLKNPPEQRLTEWYRARTTLLKKTSHLSRSRFLLRGGIDLTAAVLKEILAKYQAKGKKSGEKR